MDLITLGIAKQYVADTMAGAGAIKGDKGDKGDTPYIGDNGNWYISGTDTGVPASGGNSEISGGVNIRFKAVTGVIHLGGCYSYTQKAMRETGKQYNCIEYTFDGSEKAVRFSGASTGASDRVAYCFVNANLDAIKKADFVSGECFENVVMNIPQGTTKLFINGNGYESPHLEVAVEDLMADSGYLSQLLGRFGKRLQYKDKFAWKPMEKAHIAFTFDDSLDQTSEIADLFVRKGVPCCFGAIPDKLLVGTSAGETVLDAMNRVIAIGGEVLAHGNGDEIITAENIDDENHLYSKFIVNHQKFIDFGLNVRGVVRVGGDGNICGDSRTDEWVRLFYDYGDLYGVKEPYNHARYSGTTYEDYKGAVDRAIANRSFCPLLFHQPPEWLETLLDYAISQGAVISNYSDVYDTYGSTEDYVNLDSRLLAIEQADGNGVKY